MLDRNEIMLLIIIPFILAFTITLLESIEIFLYTLLFVFIIILGNILAKKIAAYYVDADIKIRLWEIKQYGFQPTQYFKKPFPAGAFLPIIVTAFSGGLLFWMGSLIFVTKKEIHKAAKRQGLYSYSEMPEYHLALIGAAGILVNLLFAYIGYLLGYPLLTKLSIYYCIFNLIPLSSLDGNKIFFGSKLIWSILSVIVFIGLAITFIL